MSDAVSVTDFGVANEAPPSFSSSWSPATACDPNAGRLTRKVVLTASVAFMRPSARSVLPCSTTVGAEGAVASSVKASAALRALALPALSVIRAVRDLAPSRPRSAALTVKSTYWLTMSAALSVAIFGVANATPPSSRSTLSPAAASAPALGSDTRTTVVWASTAFRRPSSRSWLPCSARVGA